MRPRVLRRLTYYFDPLYFRPDKPGRIAETLLQTGPTVQLNKQRTTQRERRCGIERRNHQTSILLDTRSQHARRKQHQYHGDTDTRQQRVGIDVYT